MNKLLVIWFTCLHLINAGLLNQPGCRVDINAENQTDIYCFSIKLEKNEIPLDKAVPPSEYLTLHLFESSGEIGENSLENLRDLTTLVIDGCKFDKVVFPELPKLTYLEIQSSTIPHLNGAFKNLKQSLSSLNIGGNSIDIKEDDLEGLDNLLRLKLYKENITLSALKNLKKLQGLDISHSNFVEIPSDAFQNNQELIHLRIGDTPITTIKEGAFDPLKKLETLILSPTKLTSFSADLTKELSNLRELGVPVRVLKDVNIKKLLENSPDFSKFDFLYYDSQCTEIHTLQLDLQKLKKKPTLGFLSDWRKPQKTC